MKKSLDVQEIVEEIKDMLEDAVNPAETIVKIADEDIIKAADFKEEDEESEDYESDNEEEDKWDNLQKACWSGYKQEGMKEKGGRMVPNCVPVKKSADNDEDDKRVVEKESPWGGAFRPKITK
jgi:hypothetical protein